MKYYFSLALIWITGFILSQIIFTVVIYYSNIALYRDLSTILDAGYLTVPNLHVLNTLRDYSSAFFGALFFSLTTGAGVTLLTFILIMLWKSFKPNRLFLSLILVLWGMLIAAINFNGINLSASAALIVIPLGVGYFTLVLFHGTDVRLNRVFFSTHIAVLSLILISWLPHLDKDVFISCRDYLLLGNPIGEKINDFYYKYTMYPAEVFKSLDQKLLRTCVLQINDDKLHEVVEKKLREKDYFEIQKENFADLTVFLNNNDLKFMHNEKKIIELSAQEFLSHPDKVMNDFSKRCDTNSIFRKITFLSLIIGSPVLIYILLYSTIMAALFFIHSLRIRFFISCLFCLIIGASLTLPFYNRVSEKQLQASISEQLFNADWRNRVAALKKICDEGVQIDQFMDRLDYTRFHHIPEKYWFAKSLSASKNEYTYKILLEYLHDPNPNVVCMALYSLGIRNQKGTTDTIIQLIETTPHWYIQWYAYKSLKKSGWTQPKSKYFL